MSHNDYTGELIFFMRGNKIKSKELVDRTKKKIKNNVMKNHHTRLVINVKKWNEYAKSNTFYWNVYIALSPSLLQEIPDFQQYTFSKPIVFLCCS